MEARYNTVLKNKKIRDSEFPAKAASLILKEFNGYGRNYWRPFIWLFCVILPIFSALYCWPAGVSCRADNIGNWFAFFCDKPGLKEFFYSISMSFGPIGLLIEPENILGSGPINFKIHGQRQL